MLFPDRVVGLCLTCAHSRRVESGKGSTFWMCELSKTDPRFRKYPHLPVMQCPGYEESEDRREK
jgi:hypothetical protein